MVDIIVCLPFRREFLCLAFQFLNYFLLIKVITLHVVAFDNNRDL